MVQDRAPALLRSLHIIEGRIIIRALWDAGKHRTFVERQILHIFPEIGLCRCLYTIGALPEINLVQVKLQYLLLGILALQLQCQKDLLHLALHGAVLRQIGILRKLLRNRGTALRDLVLAEVCPDGTKDAAGIDARVLIEAVIFDCDEGILQILRDLRNLHRHAVLCRMHIRNLIPIDVIDMGRRGRANVLRNIRPRIHAGRQESASNSCYHDNDDNEQPKNDLLCGASAALRLFLRTVAAALLHASPPSKIYAFHCTTSEVKCKRFISNPPQSLLCLPH